MNWQEHGKVSAMNDLPHYIGSKPFTLVELELVSLY